MPPPISVPAQTNNSLKRIRDEQEKALNCFWQHWRNEYLQSLTQRKKWRQKNEHIKIGQLVLINDENLAPARWLMGRIVELIPSKDGLIRSVTIQTSKNKLSRPIQKLCVLPVEPS